MKNHEGNGDLNLGDLHWDYEKQDRGLLSVAGEYLPVRGVTNLDGNTIDVLTNRNINRDISTNNLQEYYGNIHFTDTGGANGGNAGNDTISAGDGDDWIAGGGGNDVIKGGSGNDIIWGGSGNDNIKGDAGDNWIDGGAGNDTITGEDGADTIYSGDGKDNINAGNGNNKIYAGGDDDIVNSEPVKITLRPVMATIRLILVLEMIKLKVVLVSIPSKRGLQWTLLLVD